VGTGGACDQRCANDFQDAFEIGDHVIVAEADDPETGGLDV
jgi:hypothetical protein